MLILETGAGLIPDGIRNKGRSSMPCVRRLLVSIRKHGRKIIDTGLEAGETTAGNETARVHGYRR
jgi:hypothetical protein